MRDIIKDYIYAFFDSSQAVALVAISFIAFFYTTSSSKDSPARKFAKIAMWTYFALLLVYLFYRAVDARCEERMGKIQAMNREINTMIARDSSRIMGIRSKIALDLSRQGSIDSVDRLRQTITNINYNRIQRLQNFRVHVAEYCTNCNDYSETKQKFDSLKIIMSHEE